VIDVFMKGGLLMYPILLCSIVGLAILLSKFIEYKKILNAIGKPFDRDVATRFPLLAPIVEGIEKGCDEKELSVIGTRQVREIEKGLSWLSLIATIAPLLGLTGTVTGMIKAFRVISEISSVNPSMLAGGIWEALITTAAGLLVAIPIHIGHHYLEKQADDIAFILKEIALSLYMKKRNGL